MAKKDDAPRLCPIRVACRKTGLKQDTVRAWEKRYGAITPERSPTRRRLYSEAEIERLILLRRATEAGWRIGEIARLPRAELETLVAAPSAEPRSSGTHAKVPSAAENGFLGGCLSAVETLDSQKLAAAIERASLGLGRRRLIVEVLTPLLRQIGDGWEKGELRPAHEHLATAVVRSFVGFSAGRYEADERAPRLVISTPSGQTHEMGALLAAAFAEEQGWRVTYLGPSLPAEEIAFAAVEGASQAVGVGISRSPDDRFLEGELRKLRRLLPADVVLLVGGRTAPDFGPLLEEIGAREVRDLEHFHEVLTELQGGGRTA